MQEAGRGAHLRAHSRRGGPRGGEGGGRTQGQKGKGATGDGRGCGRGAEGQIGEEANPGRPSGRKREQPWGWGSGEYAEVGPRAVGGVQGGEALPSAHTAPRPPPATRAYRRCVFLRARSSLGLGAGSCPVPLLWVSVLRGLWWPQLRRVWSGTLRPPPAPGPHNFCSGEPGLGVLGKVGGVPASSLKEVKNL